MIGEQPSSLKRLRALIRTLHSLVQGKIKILEKRFPDAHHGTRCTHPHLWVPLDVSKGRGLKDATALSCMKTVVPTAFSCEQKQNKQKHLCFLLH